MENTHLNIKFLKLVLISITLFYFNASANIDANLAEKRGTFQLAEKALKLKQYSLFRSLIKEIDDYPITPYLEYDLISSNIESVSSKDIHSFFKKYKDYPFTYRLQSKWLHRLAKNKQWAQFLKDFDGRNNVPLTCLSFQAKIALRKKEVLKDIEKIWLRGYSQPKQCDVPFKYLMDNAENKTKLIWGRIDKAFKTGKTSLARYLSKSLSESDQALVRRWYRADQNPERQLKKLRTISNTEMNRKIIVHAVQRLIRQDVKKAQVQWNAIKNKFPFNQQQKDAIQHRIALSSSLQHLPQAKQLLRDLPKRLKTEKTAVWLVRINIRDQDWKGLIAAIKQLPKKIQADNEWQYWLARSYEGLGQKQKALQTYKSIATKSSYYGFLAADRIGQPYTIKSNSVVSSFNEKKLLSQNIRLLRARELYNVNRILDAKREWFEGIKTLNQSEIKQAAKIASQWQWHDTAIKTVAKTPHRTDYELRFPMPFQNDVLKHAKKRQLDPAVVYGVMRRESLFDSKAGSRVGALGLMQLMPKTAQSVAKSLGLKKPSRGNILKVENNINFGTYYFRKVLNRFADNTSMAAAAYNAGPHRVNNWLPEKDMDADRWVETIPFNETRKYVQAVLAYASIFDKKLGNDKKISSRMHKVKTEY